KSSRPSARWVRVRRTAAVVSSGSSDTAPVCHNFARKHSGSNSVSVPRTEPGEAQYDDGVPADPAAWPRVPMTELRQGAVRVQRGTPGAAVLVGVSIPIPEPYAARLTRARVEA